MSNWQAKVAKFAENRNLTHSPTVYTLDLMSEVGEVAKELLLATDYGEHPAQRRPTLNAELGDVLYSLCMLATAVDIDLDEALAQTLAKYEKRWQETGSPGSRPTQS